jgi:hypothetical protein
MPAGDRNPPCRSSGFKTPVFPLRGFLFAPPGLCVGDREARADSQGSELIDGVPAGMRVRELLFIKALGHARVPFAGHRPDHRASVELATIDPHRAAEAAADLKRRLDQVSRAKRGGTGSKLVTLRAGGGPFCSSSFGQGAISKVLYSMRTNRPACMSIACPDVTGRLRATHFHPHVVFAPCKYNAGPGSITARLARAQSKSGPDPTAWLSFTARANLSDRFC